MASQFRVKRGGASHNAGKKTRPTLGKAAAKFKSQYNRDRGLQRQMPQGGTGAV